MKNILAIVVTFILGCLTAQAEEQFAYKCILNTPEIPRFNFEKSFPKQMREALMRAPYAGYVVVKVSTKASEMVKPIGIISSDPKGVFDKMAAAYVQHMRLQAFTTGTHVGTPKLEIHVLFYTITKPKYVVGVANLVTDYVKAHELTPSLMTALINEGKALPPLPTVPR